VTALSLCVPAVIGLFLLVMERFEAALFPAAPDGAAQGDDGQSVDRGPQRAAPADLRSTEPVPGTHGQRRVVTDEPPHRVGDAGPIVLPE
jgi:hypothetical protein